MRWMQRGDPNTEPRELRDRSGRLAFFGMIAILLGGLALVFGLASLALPLFGGALLGPGSPPPDPAGALMGFLTYAIIGAAFVWAGSGALRRRRWAPVVMQTLAWTWLLFGLCLIPLALLVLDGVLLIAAGQTGELPPGFAIGIKVVVLGAISLAGVLLPATYAWAFRDPALVETCRRHDPRPAWNERCPRSVLALSLLLWAAAALLLPMALRPMVPLFGWPVTGAAGALLTLACAAISALLARGIFRLSRAAWWATTAALLLGGVSTAWTLWRVEPLRLYTATGAPVESLEGMEELLPALFTATAWTTVGLTVLSLVYMLAIRRHFAVPEDAARGAAAQT
jgi:hypothetical protein